MKNKISSVATQSQYKWTHSNKMYAFVTALMMTSITNKIIMSKKLVGIVSENFE